MGAGTTALRQGIVRLPAVYVLRLNRVNFDQRGYEVRVSTAIDYPNDLTLGTPQQADNTTVFSLEHDRPHKRLVVVFGHGAADLQPRFDGDCR